jgi:hypothetical protein
MRDSTFVPDLLGHQRALVVDVISSYEVHLDKVLYPQRLLAHGAINCFAL